MLNTFWKRNQRNLSQSKIPSNARCFCSVFDWEHCWILLKHNFSSKQYPLPFYLSWHMITLGRQWYIMRVDSLVVVLGSFGVLVAIVMSGHNTFVEVSIFVTVTVMFNRSQYVKYCLIFWCNYCWLIMLLNILAQFSDLELL